LRHAPDEFDPAGLSLPWPWGGLAVVAKGRDTETLNEHKAESTSTMRETPPVNVHPVGCTIERQSTSGAC